LPAKASASITVELAFAKSTKGTHVYAALDAGAAAVTSLYIQKAALGNTPPPKITLTIAAAATWLFLPNPSKR
jgi:hypothetical protein